MSGVAELVSPGIKLEKLEGLPGSGFRRVDRFAPTEDGVAELVNPAIHLEVIKCYPRSRYHRVDRFVRYGVDKVMEGHKKYVSMLTPGKSRYGRVSYFSMARVERPKKTENGTTKLPPAVKSGSFRHVDYFIASGIAKGEGHSGGGTVTDMLNIGMNPMHNFREVRVKRQSKPKEEIKEGLKRKEGFEWYKKLHPLDRKTSTEIMRMKVQMDEATVDMQANEEYKAKLKEEQDREKEKEYETIKRYNPWGQPSSGAPKVTKSGKLCAHRSWINGEYRQKPQADMWLLLSSREGLLEKYSRSRCTCKRMKEEEEVSEGEKKKQRKEKERKEYYVKYLERQKLKKRGSFDAKEEKVVPTDFIWGRTDVQRDMSGKLIPRKRQLYQLDTGGNCHQSFGTYFSVADKMARLPEHLPLRGTMNPDSYQMWGKPGSAALMRNTSNRNTSTVVMPKSAAVMRNMSIENTSTVVMPKSTAVSQLQENSNMCVAPPTTTMREAGVQCGS